VAAGQVNRHPSFDGKQIVITGAASGIGRAVAIAAARRGGHVHLTDRHDDELAAAAAEIRTAGGTVGVVQALDIRDRDAVNAFAAEIHDRVPHVDIVMNVAGIAAWGTVERMPHEQWQRVIDINLMGPVHVIEAFLPAMVEGGDGGHLVNVSSAAGLFGLPWHAAYSASKFGLRGLSEVLRFDLRRHRIGVSLVCPGGVDTPLTSTVEVAGVDTASKAFRRQQKLFQRHAVTPEQAAAAILHGVIRNRYLVFTSGDIRLLYAVQRIFPPAYILLMRGANRLMDRALRKALVTE
jgi:NAD(P)-dependent dehydrogenase (short-subunit alcohol dehydrogenase family)